MFTSRGFNKTCGVIAGTDPTKYFPAFQSMLYLVGVPNALISAIHAPTKGQHRAQQNLYVSAVVQFHPRDVHKSTHHLGYTEFRWGLISKPSANQYTIIVTFPSILREYAAICIPLLSTACTRMWVKHFYRHRGMAGLAVRYATLGHGHSML